MRTPFFPLVAGAVIALAIPNVPAHAARRARTAPVSCTASVMHPISVHVTPLDPIVRGGTVRLLVRATSAVALDGAETRLVSAGGAGNPGHSAVALGALSPGRIGDAAFTLDVPASGARAYVQFVVTGRGPAGTLSRGACYVLSPDGPAESGRIVVTPAGARVMEVRAGRIDQ